MQLAERCSYCLWSGRSGFDNFAWMQFLLSQRNFAEMEAHQFLTCFVVVQARHFMFNVGQNKLFSADYCGLVKFSLYFLTTNVRTKSLQRSTKQAILVKRKYINHVTWNWKKSDLENIQILWSLHTFVRLSLVRKTQNRRGFDAE